MRVLNIAARACLRSNAPVLFVFPPRLLFSLFAYQHPVNLPFRSQKVTDKLLPATTADELVAHIGMTLGEAKELKLAASSATLLPSAGGGAAVAVASGGVGSMSLGSPQPLVASAVSAACSTPTFLSRNQLQPLLQTEYRGVIDIVSGHTPSHSCSHSMLHDLSKVLPEVVRMPLIVQECARKLESLQHIASAPAVKLLPDQALAIIGYTYDLGVNCTTVDGRCSS